jgi:hypothetical protein
MSFTHLDYQVSKPSYVAIKKPLYGRQPGYFLFCFSFCPLAVTIDFVFDFVTGVFNKVPSFTHFGLLKLPKIYWSRNSCTNFFQ